MRSFPLPLLPLLCLSFFFSCCIPTVQAIPPTGATDLPERIRLFEEWLLQQHVSITDVEITSEGVKGGLGLKATRDLPEKFVFASIPLSSLINIEHVFVDEWAQQYLDPLSDTEAMAVYMARIRLRGQSPWNPYIQLLPDSFPTFPLFYDDQHRDMLQQSVVREYASKRYARAQATYERLDPLVKTSISFDDLLWGLTVLWSRTHGVKVKDGQGKWQKAACFVPVADLLNTAEGRRAGSESEGETNNADCHTNEASTHFECYVSRDVKAGEELLVPYGATPGANQATGLSNGQLLLDYGFALEQNNFDIVTVHLPALRPVGSYPVGENNSTTAIITEEVLSIQKELFKTLLKRDSNATLHQFQLHFPPASVMSSGREIDAISLGLAQFLRVWNLDQRTVRAISGGKGNTPQQRQAVIEKLKQDNMLLPTHESISYNFFLQFLLKFVGSYGTSVAEDKALWKALPQLDDHDQEHADLRDETIVQAATVRGILNLRMGEKRILYLYTNIIATYLKQLQPNIDAQRKAEAEKRKAKKGNKKKKRKTPKQSQRAPPESETIATGAAANNHEEL